MGNSSSKKRMRAMNRMWERVNPELVTEAEFRRVMAAFKALPRKSERSVLALRVVEHVLGTLTSGSEKLLLKEYLALFARKFSVGTSTARNILHPFRDWLARMKAIDFSWSAVVNPVRVASLAVLAASPFVQFTSAASALQPAFKSNLFVGLVKDDVWVLVDRFFKGRDATAPWSENPKDMEMAVSAAVAMELMLFTFRSPYKASYPVTGGDSGGGGGDDAPRMSPARNYVRVHS